jgi:cytoskeleton-associated protein 5
MCVCRFRSLVLSTIIEKGLGAARVTTRTKAVEVLLEFVAADVAEPVIMELGTFINHKQPKLVAASINVITEIVR